VRLAILISLAALGLSETAARAEDGLVPCEVGTHGGYLVTVSYAEDHRADILGTLPDEPEVYGFWKVSEQIAIVADRNLRETLEDAAKDPTSLFPDLTPGGDATSPDSLEYERNELKLIVAHYGAYLRQYVGLLIDGRQFVLLNYAVGPRLDPSRGFICIHRVFEPDRMRFLQCRFDWDYKKISNVSMFGTWQEQAKSD
jgi:hypothetical protein